MRLLWGQSFRIVLVFSEPEASAGVPEARTTQILTIKGATATTTIIHSSIFIFHFLSSSQLIEVSEGVALFLPASEEAVEDEAVCP